ncbi:MAG: acetate--CoA ligase family protein [Nocardioidaceae bacterium]|nr:acetate--CoA ligase family protein [Nocardioidaceae bacterium]
MSTSKPVPDLDRFFRPRAVAVVGASDTEGRPTTMNWRRIKEWAERVQATAYPVTPKYETVDGLRAYPRLADLPEPIDVAVLLISDVLGIIPDVIEARIPFAISFAAGFAETGADGAARQRELERLLDGSATRLLGPNTNLNAFETFRDDLPGKAIALVTQSGHQGRPVFQGQELGIRFSHWAPTGNEADLESADFVRYLAGLEETGAIAAYIEGFKDGRAFLDAARYAAGRGVPVVVVKVGRTDIGASWAQSHTGHLAGSDTVVSAALRQAGVIRVDGLDELLDTAAMLARCAPPTAPGVCVYSISGGTSAHMADMLSAAGLDLPELSEQTQAQLHEWIAPYLRVTNPVDSGGHPSGDWRGPKILDALLADPAVGVLVVPITGAFPPMSDVFVNDLVEAAARTSKPVCVVWGSPTGLEEAYRTVLLGSGIPVFRTFRNCVTAVAAYLGHHEFRARLLASGPLPEPTADPVPLPSSGGTLTEADSKAFVARYGVRVTRDVLCADAGQAVEAASALGFPVVLKVASPTIVHKSDHGLVLTGCASAAEVHAGYELLMTRAAAVPDAQVDGVLVCEQVDGGVETVVGLVEDPVFGPTVMFGIGGTAVEIYRDVAFRVAPFSRDEALAMIREVRGFPLLAGARGTAPADLEALADVVMAVQQIGLDQAGSGIELDLNPVAARPDGAVTLDAVLTVSGPAAVNSTNATCGSPGNLARSSRA